MSKEIIPAAQSVQSIHLLRGQKGMLDLAVFYGVKRNRRRFPEDFVVQLVVWEIACLRSQFVTGSEKHETSTRGGARKRR